MRQRETENEYKCVAGCVRVKFSQLNGLTESYFPRHLQLVSPNRYLYFVWAIDLIPYSLLSAQHKLCNSN